jgi:hypothetical protein
MIFIILIVGFKMGFLGCVLVHYGYNLKINK